MKKLSKREREEVPTKGWVSDFVTELVKDLKVELREELGEELRRHIGAAQEYIVDRMEQFIESNNMKYDRIIDRMDKRIEENKIRIYQNEEQIRMLKSTT